MGRKRHSDFLTVHHKALFLQIRLENPLRATQAKAHIVAELATFTGKFAACCHGEYSTYIKQSFPLYRLWLLESRGEAWYTKPMDIEYILTVLLVIFFSMTLHEVMHGLVAYRLGDETARISGRLTLNPLKHIDPFLTIGLPLLIIVTNALTGVHTPVFGGAKPVPFNPARIDHDEWGIALMAAAGPLTNLILAFISFGILVLSGGDTTLIGNIAGISALVNLGFFAFNILPIPPLDGSRVMYALAPDVVRKGMDAIERYGLIFVFILVMFSGSLLGTYMSAVIEGCVDLFGRIFGIS